jgi:phospholipase/carboxylesterase
MNKQTKNTLSCVEVNPKTTPVASVIWLHGLGADGHDFENIVPELHLPENLPVRFVFPHAPMRPVTINNGYVMRAWYDIKQLDSFSNQDEAGICESEQTICSLIEHEKTLGIPCNKIILAGFSQGGAIALHTGLHYPEQLAGILALSTYLPLSEQFQIETKRINQTIPIMMAHGTADPLIPIKFAEASRDLLTTNGYKVEWHTYPIQHSICPEEIQDIGKWIGHQSSQ